jgi:Tol biopolymer transport system component
MQHRCGSRISMSLFLFAAVLVIIALTGVVAAQTTDRQTQAFLATEMSVSPDGHWLGYTTLAYNQDGEPTSEIWVMPMKGGAAQRLGTAPGLLGVHWLDNDRIAALGFDAARLPVFSRQGQPQTIISFTDNFQWIQPAISPDGKWIVFNAVRREPREIGIFLLEVSTGTIKDISKAAVKSFCDWSPDSRQITFGIGAYQKTYQLTALDVASGAVNYLGAGVGARWSPDGKWIAYTGNVAQGGSWSSGIPGDGSILKIDPKTKKSMVLTDPPINKYEEKGNWEQSGASLPVWSRDSKKIAYRKMHFIVDNKTGNKTLDEDQVWVMNADGSNKRKVVDKYASYTWAPDGKALLVKDEKGIARVPVDGGAQKLVVSWTIPAVPEIKESDWLTDKTDGADIRYLHVPDNYAKAIMKLAAASRNYYANQLHCDMPAVISVSVSKDTNGGTSLWTDGESHMFLTVTSIDKLAPPGQSGTFNVYGISHELGHIAMYRQLHNNLLGLPEGIPEGWAHYAGSVVTDEMYKELGKDLWPIPYDYSADGSKRLEARLAVPATQMDPTTRAALAFYRADRKYGTVQVFAAMNAAVQGQANARDVMTRFVDNLAQATNDPACRDFFPNELVVAQVKWQVASRAIDDKTTAVMISTPDANGVTLSYGEDKSAGMQSIAGSGHALAFRHPAGNYAVDAVEMYGSRYGAEEPPQEDFSIYILDADFNLIKEIREPYSKLTYGDKPAWHRFAFAPVTVPEGFYVCISFNPTYNKGFYMHYNSKAANTYARTALPFTFVNDTQMTWMMKAHVRKVGE